MPKYRAPIRLHGILDNALNSDKPIILDDVTLTDRKELQKFARESGLINVKTQVKVERKLDVNPIKKTTTKRAVWILICLAYAMIGTSVITLFSQL